MQARPSKLFVGVGNVLQHDDGVGVRAAERLMALTLPADVEVFDAGSATLGLADVLASRSLVVVVDAIEAGAAPGSVFRFSPDDVRPDRMNSPDLVPAGALGLHELHLLDALEETRCGGAAPSRVVFYAVQVQDVTVGLGLSPAVEAGLERALELVLPELGVSAEILRGHSVTSFWTIPC